MSTETNGENIADLVRSGNVSLDQLRENFEVGATAGLVTIQDLGVCYSSATGQLSGFCTVVSNDSSNPITGVGMVVYSGNGATSYCVQYTNGLKSTTVAPSVGTSLYNPSSGNSALVVVYGWTAQGSFYNSYNLTIGSC